MPSRHPRESARTTARDYASSLLRSLVPDPKSGRRHPGTSPRRVRCQRLRQAAPRWRAPERPPRPARSAAPSLRAPRVRSPRAPVVGVRRLDLDPLHPSSRRSSTEGRRQAMDSRGRSPRCPFSTSSRARSGSSRPESKVATTPFAKLIVAERTRSTPRCRYGFLEGRLERDVVRLADGTIERGRQFGQVGSHRVFDAPARILEVEVSVTLLAE